MAKVRCSSFDEAFCAPTPDPRYALCHVVLFYALNVRDVPFSSALDLRLNNSFCSHGGVNIDTLSFFAFLPLLFDILETYRI